MDCAFPTKIIFIDRMSWNMVHYMSAWHYKFLNCVFRFVCMIITDWMPSLLGRSSEAMNSIWSPAKYRYYKWLQNVSKFYSYDRSIIYAHRNSITGIDCSFVLMAVQVGPFLNRLHYSYTSENANWDMQFQADMYLSTFVQNFNSIYQNKMSLK